MKEKWNENEILFMIEQYKKGLTYLEIGKLLQRSSSSIRGKLFKLGLKYRDIVSGLTQKKCIHCNIEFESKISEDRKFCSHSCSAIYNNSKRTKLIYSCCKYCNKKIKNGNNFCDAKCYGASHKIHIYSLIKENKNVSERQIKQFLIDEHGEQCMECGWNKIHPTLKKVPIQLEHMDGNSDNNTIKNCKLLCPNCHSLTPTFGALNKGNGRTTRKIKRKKYRNAVYA